MTDASFELRAATVEDAGRIAALLTEEGYPVGPSEIVERLERFQRGPSKVRVATAAGEVVGFAATHVMPRFEHSDWIARVLALVVDEGVRERGVGHLLMGDAEELARDAGCGFIEVTAGHHRPDARQLYEAVGYEGGVTTYLRKKL